REFPVCPFERYADDIIAHCDSEDQARQLRAAIAARLETLGLELHPGKTKVAYCKDANRRGDFGHTSFDFLGYTFRGRLAKGPRGYFTGFSPAISATARKAKGKQIRDWHLNRRSSADLSALAREINPRSRAGSTITEPSTAPSCASWHGASTSTSSGGPCTSSSDSAASTPKRWPGCRRSASTSHACSPTGSSSRSPKAGLWGPDDGRLSRSVLRAAGGETPPADSPGLAADWIVVQGARERSLCEPGGAVIFDYR